MRSLYLYVALGFALSGCAQEPVEAEKYRLTTEQLAWQPYRLGQTLRFGHVKDSKIRTYRITEVQDGFDQQYIRGAWLPVPAKQPALCQHVTVLAQRTDSVIYSPKYGLTAATDSVIYSTRVIDLTLYLKESSPLVLLAQCDWERSFSSPLPLEEVTNGLSITQPIANLLPSITIGTKAYTETLRIVLNYNPSPSPRIKVVRILYYAKNVGVVGFEEDGTGLWYRL